MAPGLSAGARAPTCRGGARRQTTLRKRLPDKGAIGGSRPAKVMAADRRDCTCAGTFPDGTPAMRIHDWLAAAVSSSDGKSPNDQGIGVGLATLVGILRGVLISRFALCSRRLSPQISLFKPLRAPPDLPLRVSPPEGDGKTWERPRVFSCALAWRPAGLLVFQAANPAAIWTIFIRSNWPMVFNTAGRLQRVPQDHLDRARLQHLSA